MKFHSIWCRNSNICEMCLMWWPSFWFSISHETHVMEHSLSSHCVRCGNDTTQQMTNISATSIESKSTNHLHYLSPFHSPLPSALSDIPQAGTISTCFSTNTVAMQTPTHTHTHSKFMNHSSDNAINLIVLVRNVLIGDLGSSPYF